MPNPYYNNIRTNIPFSIADGNSIDNDFDGITSGFAMVSSDVTRAIKLPVGTLTDQVITGSAAVRANMALVFDDTGLLTLTPSPAVTTAQVIANIKWLGVQTASYAAAPQDGVPFDNTAAATSLTLPTYPAYGQEVWFHDVAGMFKTNPLTVLRNGNLIMGLAEDSIVSTNNIKAGVKFYGATIGWRLFV